MKFVNSIILFTLDVFNCSFLLKIIVARLTDTLLYISCDLPRFRKISVKFMN